MSGPRQVISYASPASPARKPTPRIVWWFVAAGTLFFLAMFLAVAAGMHEDLNPNNRTTPPAVESLLSVLLFASLALLGILVGCTFGIIRRWWRGRPL